VRHTPPSLQLPLFVLITRTNANKDADPRIEVFDVLQYAGKTRHIQQSLQLVTFYKEQAEVATSAFDKANYLASAEMHEELVELYQRANKIKEEVDLALLEEALEEAAFFLLPLDGDSS
jgi:hypothetical protein